MRQWTGAIRGEKGLIKWQHYPAAAVAQYEIIRPDSEWRVKAFIFEVNAYNMAPPHPLTLHVQHKRGAWKFPILTFERDEYGRFSATLGPPEGLPGNGAIPLRTA